jgi:hypothetical protein
LRQSDAKSGDEIVGSRRAALGAAFRHACVLNASAFGFPAPPDLVEELEIDVRLEWVAYEERRTHRETLALFAQRRSAPRSHRRALE